MTFKGITKRFSLINEDQYNTIGAFWEKMASIYGLENLIGLGYKWEDNYISYAIGLINNDIKDFNLVIELPDDGWITVYGRTDELKEIYDEIYKDGPLTYELETFTENGDCKIVYFRKK